MSWSEQEAWDWDCYQRAFNQAVERGDSTAAAQFQEVLKGMLTMAEQRDRQYFRYDVGEAVTKTFQELSAPQVQQIEPGGGGEYASEAMPVSNGVQVTGGHMAWSDTRGSNYVPQHYDKITQTWYDAQPARKEEPVKPEIRVGDKERGRYIDHLGNMFAGGYLTQEEFESRMELASSAKAESHLKTLVEDLPPMPSPFRGEPVVLNEKRSLARKVGPYAWVSLVGMLLFLLVLAFI